MQQLYAHAFVSHLRSTLEPRLLNSSPRDRELHYELPLEGGSDLDLAGQASTASAIAAATNCLYHYARPLLRGIDQAMTLSLRTVMAIEHAFDGDPFNPAHSEHATQEPACQTRSTGLNFGINTACALHATLGINELYTQSDDQFGLTGHEIVDIYDQTMIDVALQDSASLAHCTLKRNVLIGIERNHNDDTIREQALDFANEQRGEIMGYLQSA
jgi:hypothetical protein